MLKERDYYAKNFFVHRLANAIRATGNPLAVVSHKDLYESDHIFTIVDFINQIIKGCHENNKNAPRRLSLILLEILWKLCISEKDIMLSIW